MKYKKYITVAFLALILVPSLIANKGESSVEADFDIKNIVFIEDNATIELGFDTKDYLPEGFNAYEENTTIEAINFIENDEINLGFDTKPYLPKGFNAYK
jgi:hypothetical protein